MIGRRVIVGPCARRTLVRAISEPEQWCLDSASCPDMPPPEETSVVTKLNMKSAMAGGKCQGQMVGTKARKGKRLREKHHSWAYLRLEADLETVGYGTRTLQWSQEYGSW